MDYTISAVVAGVCIFVTGFCCMNCIFVCATHYLCKKCQTGKENKRLRQEAVTRDKEKRRSRVIENEKRNTEYNRALQNQFYTRNNEVGWRRDISTNSQHSQMALPPRYEDALQIDDRFEETIYLKV
ncbi:hypothetical protein LOD99_15783 [Oopsacas minuta]|uniref:Uncharacterized protein n=1 Tax=Oopsacas minuta TaxID=111878 RepID=A0AAV7KAY0_9METZ|nr:hypothetical protein LOD99_15783 [Oopsacas minuta]